MVRYEVNAVMIGGAGAKKSQHLEVMFCDACVSTMLARSVADIIDTINDLRGGQAKMKGRKRERKREREKKEEEGKRERERERERKRKRMERKRERGKEKERQRKREGSFATGCVLPEKGTLRQAWC